MENYTEYSELSSSQLKRWWSGEKNVLIYGDHGCGKTTIVKQFWDSLGIKYAMFSGSTLDPWTDLVGVPKVLEKEGRSVLSFVTPENIDDDVEAIFIDEINRSHAKVRNALLELMQFKTINGRHFPKLKVVWSAANPPDSAQNYDVEPLDPAQEDRYHVIVKLKSEPNLSYFTKKYGADVASAAILWHKGLSEEYRAKISPRRLDYALANVLIDGGVFRESIPYANVNVSSLERAVKFDSSANVLKNALRDGDRKVIDEYFKTDKYEDLLPAIIRDYDLAKGLVEEVDSERLFSLGAAEPSLALLLSDPAFQREDFTEAIEAFKETHNEPPSWFQHARSYAVKLRSLHTNLESTFEEKFTKSKFKCPDIGELHTQLIHEKLENLIDEIDIPERRALIEMSDQTAVNILKLARDHYSKYQEVESHVRDKFETMIYSALYKLYSKFGQLVYLGFMIKGFEIAIRPVTVWRKPSSPKASVPRPIIPTNRSQSRGKGKIKEEEIL